MNTRQLYEAVPVTEELPKESGNYNCIWKRESLSAYFNSATDRWFMNGLSVNPILWLRPLPPQEDNTLAFAEWISVDDKFPDKDEQLYLVYRDCGDHFITDVQTGITINRFGNMNNITHWQPLPKPPKP